MSIGLVSTLGAGFLTGNLVNNQHDGTRMAADNPLGKAMQRVFSGEELHRAVKKFDVDVRAQGFSSLEVAVRWALHHSALGDGDGIIIGASKESQLQESVSFIRKGRLPSTVVALVEDLWTAVSGTRGKVL